MSAVAARSGTRRRGAGLGLARRRSSSSRPRSGSRSRARMVAPWIMIDELVYSELAKSLRGARPLPRPRRRRATATASSTRSLIAPAWRLFGADPDAYAAAKAINAVVMSLAAVPAYFLARRLLAPAARARRRGAHGARPVDALHGHADDRERVLPAVPRRRARARARRSSGRRRCGSSSLLVLCGARVRDARAGGRARRRRRDRAARCSR